MQKYLLAALVVANSVLACESGSTTASTDDATFVAPDTKVLSDTNGPTKPEPVELGEYKVERAHADDKYEVVGMWDTEKYTARVIYTAAFGSEPAQYQLLGYLPEFTCTANGTELVCEQWTDVDGTLANATGTVAKGNATIELKVKFISYVGTPNEDIDLERFRLTRVE